MKKIRSEKLWRFLVEQGVLEQSQEAIRQAKIEYRRRYKREHRRAKKKIELRPGFSNSEFEGIALRAKLYGLNPTRYARELILNAQQQTDLIPNKSELLFVLQAISMSYNALLKSQHNEGEVKELLQQAEEVLIHYLKLQ